MNLHAAVVGAIGAVNPNVTGKIVKSTGYNTAPSGRRTPATTTVDNVQMQVQALTAKDLEHLDSLNIQNVTRAVYVNGDVQGVDRATGKGGDLLKFNGATWLATIVFETWDASGWCRVGVTKQTDPAT